MKSVKAGGVWKHTDKQGRTYLQGKLGAMYIQIRPNGFKEKESDPDYIMYFVQTEPTQKKFGSTDSEDTL